MKNKEDLLREHKRRMKAIELRNIESGYRETEEEAMKPRKKLEESKIYIRLMFVLTLEIILFAEFVMFRTGDLSALYALIGISATLAASLFAYFSKAKLENSIKLMGNMPEDGEEEVTEDEDNSVG